MANTVDIDAEIRENEREIEMLMNINRQLVNILNFVEHVGNSLDALSLTASRYLNKRNSLFNENPEDANTLKDPDTERVDGSDADKLIDNKNIPEK